MISVNLKPHSVPSDGARDLDQFPGEKIAFLLSGEDTGGSLAVCQYEHALGSGPPLHVHHREDETFYVLEGEVEIQVGEDRFTVTAGDTAFFTQRYPARLSNRRNPNRPHLILNDTGWIGRFFCRSRALFDPKRAGNDGRVRLCRQVWRRGGRTAVVRNGRSEWTSVSKKFS